jgi:7-keto-8-aminopelargonate synthetase-like enzyme
MFVPTLSKSIETFVTVFVKMSIHVNTLFVGSQRYHIALENLLAEFLGVESCIAFGMVCRNFFY